MDHLCYFSPVFVVLSCASVYTLWSPAGKEANAFVLGFLVSNYELVTFSLVSWVRCGT